MTLLPSAFADHHDRTRGKPRSPAWHAVRLSHLKEQPCCQVCGGKERLNVHHKKPFHLFPELELVDANLITLCEGPGVNCHFLFGHLRDWSAYNPAVDRDTAAWRDKIKHRKTS